MDMDNRTNEVFLSFDPFSSEISLGDRLIDVFLVASPFISQIEKAKKILKHTYANLTKSPFYCQQIQNL